MESLYLLVPIALILIAVAIKILFWAVNSGQYDDLDTEGHRILFDDEPTIQKKSASGAEKAQSEQVLSEKVQPDHDASKDT